MDESPLALVSDCTRISRESGVVSTVAAFFPLTVTVPAGMEAGTVVVEGNTKMIVFPTAIPPVPALN